MINKKNGKSLLQFIFIVLNLFLIPNHLCFGQFESELENAVKTRNRDEVKRIIESGARIYQKNIDHVTPLQMAIGWQLHDIAQDIIFARWKEIILEIKQMGIQKFQEKYDNCSYLGLCYQWAVKGTQWTWRNFNHYVFDLQKLMESKVDEGKCMGLSEDSKLSYTKLLPQDLFKLSLQFLDVKDLNSLMATSKKNDQFLQNHMSKNNPWKLQFQNTFKKHQLDWDKIIGHKINFESILGQPLTSESWKIILQAFHHLVRENSDVNIDIFPYLKR
jgi:hypothetical protein